MGDLDAEDEAILREGVTIWFDFDIAKMVKNPFMVATEFGQPCTIGKGNAFAERDLLEECLRDACERLATAGFPANDLESILNRPSNNLPS